MHQVTVLRGCHDEVSHLGICCMLDLMHEHFFWPQMATSAKLHVKKCHQCISFKAKQQLDPMENIMATHHLQLVHIDYLCLEPGRVRKTSWS